MKRPKSSIVNRLSVYLVGFGFLFFAAASMYAFFVSRKYAVDAAKERVFDLAQAISRQLDSEAHSVETSVNSVADTIGIFQSSTPENKKVFRSFLRRNPNIFSIYAGFAPNAYQTDKEYRLTQVWREGSVLHEKVYDSDFNYFERIWYQQAQQRMSGSWTNVYLNKGESKGSDGSGYVLSYSVPLLENNSFAGAVAADLLTDSLARYTQGVGADSGGYVFIIERGEGRYLMHPDDSVYRGTRTAVQIARESGDPQRQELINSVMDGKSGELFVHSLHKGKDEYLVCFTPLQRVNWTVAVAVPYDEILSGIHTVAIQMVIIALIAFVCFWYLIRRICRSIVGPLEVLDSAAVEIAQGNLTVSPPQLLHEDEMGRLCDSVRQMASGLASLVGQVQKTTIHLATATAQIFSSSASQEEVVSGFEEEFSQAAAAVAEISASAKELARTMQDVRTVSLSAAGRAGKGKTDITVMENTMRGLQDSTSSMAGKLELVRQNAVNIDSVVNVITDLAEQTNLLSLNASVEAEKAGEYGRGFTVVAREIRRLSDKTAVATLEISEIVGRMQESVESGVAELQLFSETVSNTVEKAMTLGQQMTQLIQEVTGLTPKIQAVNDGVQAQSTGAGEISQVMKRLKSAAEQISEDMNHFKQATQQLRTSADSLQEKTSRFRT